MNFVKTVGDVKYIIPGYYKLLDSYCSITVENFIGL